MKVKETPVVFECEGEQLIGILHIPERPLAAGILGVTAGGMQYRVGCGRQLLLLARFMAAQGTPVMRFDRRGIGDSAGELLGFEYIEADVRRAIEVFKENVPELDDVVLFGGCEAASGIMISACNLDSVTSVIVANPWVSDSMQAVVSRRHYYRRLRDPRFWKKLFTFQYDLAAYAAGFVSHVKNRLASLAPKQQVSPGGSGGAIVPFQQRMLSGFQKFQGSALLLKSGQSLISDEFDDLVLSSKPWQKACHRAGVTRLALPESDQTFSTEAARAELSQVVSDWMREINALQGVADDLEAPYPMRRASTDASE